MAISTKYHSVSNCRLRVDSENAQDDVGLLINEMFVIFIHLLHESVFPLIIIIMISKKFCEMSGKFLQTKKKSF